MGEPIAVRVMGVGLHLVPSGEKEREVAEEIRLVWERCLDESAGDDEPAATLEVFLDPSLMAVTRAKERGALAASGMVPLMDELSTRVVQLGLEHRVGTALLLHACALTHPETGATVVLVAPSGTGKTTAATTLGRHFGYLTDETAVIELDGAMTPFPKPLSLLVDGARPKRQVAPAELGLRPATPGAHLTAIAVLQRDPDAEGVRVEAVPTVEALALLAEQSSSLHLLDQPLRTVAELLHARGGLRRLVYAECADLVPVVTEWMEQA